MPVRPASFAEKDEYAHYLDISSVYLDSEGTLNSELMPDLLHPNEAGYSVWAETMELVLKQLLK